MEPRQIDRQSDTTSLQDRTSFVVSSRDGATDTEPSLGVQTTPHPKMHQKNRYYLSSLKKVSVNNSRYSASAILGINTFTQQAIQSVACVKADSTTEAWVRTAQIIYNEDGGAVLPNIDIAATEAIFQGRDTDNKQSSFYCPSGNYYVITDHTPTSIDDNIFSMTGLRANKDFYCQSPTRNRTTDVRLGPNTPVETFDCSVSNGSTPHSSQMVEYFTTANFSNPAFATRFGMVTAILSGIGRQADIPPIGKACNIPGQRDDGPTSVSSKSSQIYSTNQTNQTNQEDWYEFGIYGFYVDPCYINGIRVNHSQTPPLFTGDNYTPNNSQPADLDCWYGFTGSFPGIFTQQSLYYGPSNWDGTVPSILGEYWLRYLLGFPWYLEPDFMDPLDTISTGIDNVATTMTNALREIGNNSYGGISKANGTVLIKRF
ncbi:hypothetical protein CIB48_g6080 [Xylaria polymorpha]|nr:hypothetical protein CIB48_g6080 [Xylaria polymorpha]